MKNLIFQSICLLILFSCGKKNSDKSNQSENKLDKPNVLIILTDDQGTMDMNCYGSHDLTSPNMDRLAASGLRFTQFYAGAPICSPSRASLLTGRTNLRAGIPSNVPIPEYEPTAGMPTEQITMAEIFKQAGYTTGHIGKWHLGEDRGKLPNDQGFDYSFGFHKGCIDNYSHYFFWAGPNKHDLWRNRDEVYYPGQYFPDLMVKEVKGFLEKNQQKPFMLYWAINVPHYPYQGTMKWLDHYKDMPMPRKLYAAFLSTIDERIGEVLDKLEALHLRKNTIIVFQSDHGHSCEERAFGGGGNAGPFRGAKFSLFEGGIRVPALISWPDHIPQGEMRNQWGVSMDWLPTLAELCGVSLPDEKLDGQSLVSVLKDGHQPSPHQIGYWQTGKPYQKTSHWMVRDGEWKLLGNPLDPSHKAPLTEGDSLFLVNLKQDSTEMQNLSAQYPEKVGELKNIHTKWLASIENEMKY